MDTFLRTVSQMYQRKKTFHGLLLFGGVVLIYFMVRTKSDSDKLDELINEQRLIIPQDPDLEKVPAALTQTSKCPACLGQSLCEDIDQGIIKIRPQSISDEGFKKGSVYYGKYEESEVILKTLSPLEDWNKFDSFLCRNMSQGANCDVSSVILKSYMAKPQLSLTTSHLKEAYRIVHEKPDGLSIALCLSDGILDVIKDVNANGVNDERENENTAEVYTSTVVNQEAVLSMYLKVSQADWAFPMLEGTCGRLLIYRHPGKPLRNFVDSPWKQRADYAVQIFQLIDSFVSGDSELFLAISDFSYDKFAVDEDEQLVYTDMSDLLIAERSELSTVLEMKEKCNIECFREFTQGLLSEKHQEQKLQCSRLALVAPNVMYSLACKLILSDLPEHRKDRPHNLPGLLHDPPAKHTKDLQELLRECVEETEAGGRLQAVEEIVDILQVYIDE